MIHVEKDEQVTQGGWQGSQFKVDELAENVEGQVDEQVIEEAI